MDVRIFFAIFAAYLVSLILYFMNFELQSEPLLGWAQKSLLAGLVMHAAFLVALFMRPRSAAGISLSEDIYLVTFMVLVFSFSMEWRYRARYLMLFSLPVTLLFCLLAVLASPQRSLFSASAANGPWLWLHLGLILAGFAGLLTAASSALMYLLQSAQLKSKHLGRIFLKLPSLNTLDSLHFGSLSLGVILFSLGILSGIFWAKNMGEFREIFKDPKIWLSFLTCFMYWLVLTFRLSALRRGQKIAAGTLVIFALLIITWMSSYYAPSMFHKGI